LSFNIQIPTNIIRNKEINAMEFVLLAKIIQAYYLSGKEDEFELHHKNLIYFMSIGDNNTFKKAYNNLHKQGYLLNKIDQLPRKGGVSVQVNPAIIPELTKGIAFTQLSKDVLDKVVIDEIGYIGIRLIYYYQSHINKKGRDYCFASEETIAADLGITKKTVITYNKQLKKIKMVKIESHVLKDDGSYTTKGNSEVLTFQKYNNHYFVKEDMIKQFAAKKQGLII
jgi:hypothetical protein